MAIDKHTNSEKDIAVSIPFLREQIEKNKGLHEVEDIDKMFFKGVELKGDNLVFTYTYEENINE
jgi:hypothetical protein